MTWDKMVVSSCQLSKNLPFLNFLKKEFNWCPVCHSKTVQGSYDVVLGTFPKIMNESSGFVAWWRCMVFFKMYSKKIVSHPYSRVCIFKTLNVISFQNYTYLQTYSNVQILTEVLPILGWMNGFSKADSF